ncbi:MAG: 16S rRNA (cytosine(1402)-N(4))-methyltransferase RsmH [Phycisphaerae bacterium]|nr:16S rRNA (cytosine(1402)-N(4))-methyltransferase RsmH [Phycisphaerae bacterium]
MNPDSPDNGEQSSDVPRPPRRKRYWGNHPTHFDEKYKELSPERYPDMHDHIRAQGRTPAGAHVPIMVAEVVAAMHLRPGYVVADGTLGYGGHAEAVLPHILPGGRLVGFDVDREQLDRTAARLRAAFPDATMSFHHGNFAGLDRRLAGEGLDGYDSILVDLGVSSMQIDDPSRGFSYKHDGPLDMRMDSRLARTAADLLATISEEELAAALDELADEPDHVRIARTIVSCRNDHPIATTGQLADLVLELKGLTRSQWARRDATRRGETHPAARTFQALRILVNDEFGSLRQLLRVAPWCLRSGGHIVLLTFHSGEERIVRRALADGHYAEASDEPVRPSAGEIRDNPRCTSARLHWARKG